MFHQHSAGSVCWSLLPLQTVRVAATVSTGAESFQILGAPDLIPVGSWKKIPGGVCAAKGFKATGRPAVNLQPAVGQQQMALSTGDTLPWCLPKHLWETSLPSAEHQKPPCEGYLPLDSCLAKHMPAS